MLQWRGFTIIELVVVMSIILILSAILIPSFKQREETLSLQRSAYKLTQDLRRAQELSMSVKEFRGSIPKGGYGIYLATSQPESYILFADCDGNHLFNGETEKVEEIKLEKGVKIKSPPSLTISFFPPNPQVYFSPDASTVSISLTNDSQTKTVKVNKAGLINVE